MVTNTEVKDCEDRYKFLIEAQKESEETVDQLAYELYKPLTKSRYHYVNIN